MDSFAGSGTGFRRISSKIDVEGAELVVLRGMGDILAARARPRIMIEVTNEPEMCFEILNAADYLLFDEKRRRVSQPG